MRQLNGFDCSDNGNRGILGLGPQSSPRNLGRIAFSIQRDFPERLSPVGPGSNRMEIVCRVAVLGQ
jgi:hypothetical protein